MLPPLQATRSPQQDVAQLEQNVAAAIKPVLSVPLLDQVIVKGILFPGGGTVVVTHGLGAKPQGYVPVRRQGGSPSFYETTSDANTITFQSATACTVDMVFHR